MRPALKPHPDTPCPAVRRLEVVHHRPAAHALTVQFAVLGDIGALRIPPSGMNERTDGLWKHTCFEAFVWCGRGDAYSEFNLSPSGQWAAYAFDDYREGMRPLDVTAPRIVTSTIEERFEIEATLSIDDDRNWQIKPTAVIETNDGRLSYWAFEHPTGKPDFHHRSGYGYAIRPVELP